MTVVYSAILRRIYTLTSMGLEESNFALECTVNGCFDHRTTAYFGFFMRKVYLLNLAFKKRIK